MLEDTPPPMRTMAEDVLIVPRAELFRPGAVHGFSPNRVEAFLDIISHHSAFRPRALVEDDPSLKQIIPYLIVRHHEQLFLFQRLGAGGEARLHGKYSIGVGGHINRSDVDGAADVVAEGLRRELEEELVLEGPWSARLVGVLNDDSNAVGRVHFGLVHVVEVAYATVKVRESKTLTGYLADTTEIRVLRDSMETWSQLILDAGDPMAL
jgi:predicted NUDIX family phosphoesterase